MITAKISFSKKKQVFDKDIKEAWQLMEAQRLTSIIFADGYIDNYLAFKQWVYNKDNQFFFMYFNNVLVAFFWLNNHTGLTAMSHFCIFKNGKDIRLALAEKALDWCFRGGLTSLWGLLPSNYMDSLKFLKEIGFKEIGKLKSGCEVKKKDGTTRYIDGIIVILNKEEE